MSKLIASVVPLLVAHFLWHAYCIGQSTDVHYALNTLSSVGLFLGCILFSIMGAAFVAAKDE